MSPSIKNPLKAEHRKTVAASHDHKPVRGRPTADQATSIERAIVDVARAMFLSDGFDAVGMKQVAERARVSKGTLYARYPSKEALFTAVIERLIAAWSAEASQDNLSPTASIEQRLRHHATTISTWLQRQDVMAVQRLALSMGERFPALARTVRQHGYDYIVGLIASDIERAAAEEGRSVRDARAVARLLVAGITGAHIQEGADSSDDAARQAFAQRVVDIIMCGQNAW